MNILDALRLMVRNYPGGIAAVCLRLGKSRSTLEKELANVPGNKLGVLDACAISAMCLELRTPHAHAYANAVAGECGGFVELRLEPGTSARNAPAASAARLVQECSQALSATIDALADDGRISANELRTIEREAEDVIARAQELVRGARQAHEACKPPMAFPDVPRV